MAYDKGNVILGGDASLYQFGSGIDLESGAETRNNVRGVFATYPAMTPKYHTGYSRAGVMDASLEKMARMFIVYPSNVLKTVFGQGDPVAAYQFPSAAQPYAKKLAASASDDNTYNYGMGYIDFLLAEAHESHAEKVQVVDVLADGYVSYFFGAHPPVFRYAGWLLNSVQDDWRAAFSIIYNHIIRGTQLARRKIAVTLAYDKVMVTGSILNMNQTLTAGMELASRFSFDFLVKRYDVMPPVFPPTPVKTFPYNITPDQFTSTVVEKTQKTLRDVQDPVLGSQRAAKDTQELEPTGVFPEGDIRGEISAAQKEAAETGFTIKNSILQNIANVTAIDLATLQERFKSTE